MTNSSSGWSKSEVRDRLLDQFFDMTHDEHCSEPDPHFEDEDTDRPERAGCLTIKCWNCRVQDHFLYTTDDETDN